MKRAQLHPDDSLRAQAPPMLTKLGQRLTDSQHQLPGRRRRQTSIHGLAIVAFQSGAVIASVAGGTHTHRSYRPVLHAIGRGSRPGP